MQPVGKDPAGDPLALKALLNSAVALEAADRPKEALAAAWRALDLMPADLRAKRQVVRVLRDHPAEVRGDRREHLRGLLRDAEIAPDDLAVAAWNVVLAGPAFAKDEAPQAAAQAVENDDLALSLLVEACVVLPEAESAMAAVRRWLLLSRKWTDHPRLARALAAQATLNGGAWPFDVEEREALAQPAAEGFSPAYLAAGPTPAAPGRFAHAVTQAVADQYVLWPYPQWSRITVPEPRTVPAEVAKLDAGRPSHLPVRSEILVAGCGTGREAALLARRFPEARVTAIDLSERSLAYAAERCGGLEIDFRMLDIHEVASLGRRFHFIACSGVLHHMPDPETGWERLAAVLVPGGVMRVLLYSRAARLGIVAARKRIADLLTRPVDDDLLREIRRRLIDTSPHLVSGFTDFYSLAGVHDLLSNRHEDPFDVERIRRALERLRLELLAFRLPTDADEGLYRSAHPHDPLFRDFDAWKALEKAKPMLFTGMYDFWCRNARA